MSIKATCSHVINDDDTITFHYEVTSSSNITYIYLEYYGYGSSNQPIMELKEFTDVGKSWQYTWAVQSHIVPWIQGTYMIKATNSGREETSKSGTFFQEKKGSMLNVWGAANNFEDYVTLWGYGEADIENPIHYAKFEWTGFDGTGQVTTGEKLLPTVFLAEPSLSVKTNCSSHYKGSAKITMNNGITSKISNFNWCAKSENEEHEGLTMTSLRIDKNGTTGMVDGKFVIGTKLLIEAKIDDSNATKIITKQDHIYIDTTLGYYILYLKEYFIFKNFKANDVTWTIEKTSGDIGTLKDGKLTIDYQRTATAKVTAAYRGYSASIIVEAVGSV